MIRNRLSLPASVIKEYALKVILGKMAPLQLQIGEQHKCSFPKERTRLKSNATKNSSRHYIRWCKS